VGDNYLYQGACTGSVISTYRNDLFKLNVYDLSKLAFTNSIPVISTC
jgi:hypothetical protein